MIIGDLPESADIIKAILSNNPGSDTVMTFLDTKDAKDYMLALMMSNPAEKALLLVGKVAKIINNNILINAAEKISIAKTGQCFILTKWYICHNQDRGREHEMSRFIEKLLSICSDELSYIKSDENCKALQDLPLAHELKDLLARKNGFYGFEYALHVFPWETTDSEIGMLDWNKESLWISSYDDMAKGAFFFAEDILGCQFCLKNDGVYTFDPETGGFDKLANNINEWCQMILSDYRVLTGYSLAHDWQVTNGEISQGYRLAPKIPFVAGGLFELDNLYLGKSFELLKARANIAIQIRDVPEGGSINLTLNY